ncbi:hypothetical protein GGF47_005182, partial [Coemansia sp. RSA 2524]
RMSRACCLLLALLITLRRLLRTIAGGSSCTPRRSRRSRRSNRLWPLTWPIALSVTCWPLLASQTPTMGGFGASPKWPMLSFRGGRHSSPCH